MWTSVPQIDAILTRMRTSSAVGSGTGTCWTCVLFGAGFSLTAAFIRAGMRSPPTGQRARMRRRRFNLVLGSTSRQYPACICSGSYCVELAGPVSHHDEQVLFLREFPVQFWIARIDAEDRCRVQLRRGRDDDDVLQPDPADHRRAQLEVPPAEDEPLCPDRGHHQLRGRVEVQESQDPRLT